MNRRAQIAPQIVGHTAAFVAAIFFAAALRGIDRLTGEKLPQMSIPPFFPAAQSTPVFHAAINEAA